MSKSDPTLALIAARFTLAKKSGNIARLCPIPDTDRLSFSIGQIPSDQG
jgi:hypothetical protein